MATKEISTKGKWGTNEIQQLTTPYRHERIFYVFQMVKSAHLKLQDEHCQGWLIIGRGFLHRASYQDLRHRCL